MIEWYTNENLMVRVKRENGTATEIGIVKIDNGGTIEKAVAGTMVLFGKDAELLESALNKRITERGKKK